MPLTAKARRRLLAVARETISEFVRNGRRLSTLADQEGLHEELGCFVTLRLRGELRGCIGTFRTDQALIANVAEMAIAAASEDPRFPPVHADELAHIDLEISVLSRRRPVSGPAEIVVGRHGVWLEARGHRGVLLPQVATEAGWDSREFIENVCRKARLPEGAWRDEDAVVEVFEAEVFGEDD